MKKRVKIGKGLYEWRVSAKRSCQHVTRWSVLGSTPAQNIDQAISRARKTDCPKCVLESLTKPNGR